jgi:EmrB/QacA subfamily drug resistance transporter
MAQSITANNTQKAMGREQDTSLSTLALDNRRLIPVLTGLLLGMLLAALDQTIVGTAMPHIVTELGGSNITWVVTSYLLASTVSVPIIGKLSDIYGRRVFFLSGMVIFLLGSALSGTSQNMAQLVIYRGIQGLGAGALMPIALATIGDIFPPAERGKWQGLFTAVFGLASIIGPLLGGAITDHWGWRWAFYVNMPVGAVALVAAGLTLPALTNRVNHKIDYLGASVLVIWAVSLLLGFSLGGTELAWNSWQIVTLFIVAGVGLVAFIFIEMRQPEPIINPRLFENDIFSISVLSMFLLSAGMFGAITYLTFFVQAILGQTATNSGIILMPMMLGFIVSSIIGGQLLSRTGRYKVLGLSSFAVAAFGMFLLSRMGIHTSNSEVVRNMIVTGLGIGVLMSLFTIIVQNAFSRDKLGQVTSSLTFFRSMGSSIGVAVLGAIVTNVYSSKVQANMPGALKPYVDTGKLTNLSTAKDAVNIQEAARHLGPQIQPLMLQFAANIKESLSSSITLAFTIGFFAMVVALVVAFFLREIPLRGQEPVAAESREDASQTASEAVPDFAL